MRKIRRNKYRNIPIWIYGKRFASKKEGKRYLTLLYDEKNDRIEDLICQPIFKFPMGFSYRADFMYQKNGKTIVEDVKGVETQVFKLKRKCFEHFYPQHQLIII